MILGAQGKNSAKTIVGCERQKEVGESEKVNSVAKKRMRTV